LANQLITILHLTLLASRMISKGIMVGFWLIGAIDKELSQKVQWILWSMKSKVNGMGI
jgi:hypothetical protein